MAGTVRESIVPLKHADTEWAVRQRIELAPGEMIIRELLQNAIENARLLSAIEDRKIVLRGVQWRAASDDSPIRKLAIWNRGPGMNEEKLLSILDLAASGDEKRQGADANFGVGAKTAGLKASPEGLRYRSCFNGRVYEAVIGYRKGVFGKIKRLIGNQWCEVWDATEVCMRESYPLHHDWTEVLLMGMTRDHDTVENLFLDDACDQVWLTQTITRRFYDLSHVDVQRDDTATPTTDHGRRLLGLTAIPARQDEVVSAMLNGHRIKIRYGIMKERSGGGTDTRLGYTAHACVVFSNECFDFHESLPWRRVAPRFGIAHGQGQVFIHVLLPDKYPAVFDQYRKNIENPDRTRFIRLEDFQETVFENRPKWLLDFIASQAPAQMEMSDALKKRLKELTDYLKWYRELYKADPDGELMIVPGHQPSPPSPPGPEPDPTTEILGEKDENGLRPASEHLRRIGTIPKDVWVKGGTASQRGELSQRCARYDRQLHKVFLNDQFEGIERSVNMVMAEFQHVRDQSALQLDALKYVKEEITYRAIEHIMLGLVHESLEHWSRADVKSALTCEAISVPLSDYRSIASAVMPRLRPTYGKA